MVDIYKLKLTNLQQEILRLLFTKTGTSLNQRRIASFLDVSPTAIMKSLPFLEKEGFIKITKDKESGRLSIELNRDNNHLINLKKLDNLRKIYDSELAEYLSENYAGSTIVVFGSFSKGEDNFNSDIDLAIIGRKDKNLNLDKFEKILERKIQLSFYESWQDINKQLRNNILNGIIIAGGVDL